MTNIVKVVFEKVELRNAVTVVRLVSFRGDEETGAICVYDILEADLDNPRGIEWIAKTGARDYEGVPMFVRNELGKYQALEQFDTGRARKLESKLVRAISQATVQEY